MRSVFLALAALAGVSMAVQGTVNSILGKRIGTFEASFLVHGLGAVILGFILVSGISRGDLRQLFSAPWYAFLGAPLSVLIVWSVMVSISRAGVGAATTAIVAAQITTALILDCLGVTGKSVALTASRAAGALMFIAGVYLLLREKP